MFGIVTKFVDHTRKVAESANRAAFKSFQHAAASIRKTAVAKVEKAEGPSQPGTAPHTHRRQFLRRAIRFAVFDEGAVVGPMHSLVGESMQAHEFGGEYKGDEYPERPLMFPSLEENTDRFAGEFAGSIGE